MTAEARIIIDIGMERMAAECLFKIRVENEKYPLL